MEFNVENVVKDMLSAVKTEAGTGWSAVQATAKEFLERKEARYKMVADLILSGQISETKFKSILKDEALLLESELLALAVISKAAAQKAANAAIEVLEKAVNAALGI